MRRIAILDAPSNLGLRPPTETSVPGCAKAPGALRDHGLLARLGARDAGCLTPPRYDPGDWRPGDGVCHASEISAYSRKLADRIGAIIDLGEFPVILGGDCSIVLGSGLAMHRLGDAIGGRIGLVFVDGHSDFRHPGNASYVGAAAGEDLALVTGRGQADLAAMEGRRPYFRDIDVVVMGIRPQDEYRLDLQAAGIVTRPVPTLRVEGAARSAQWARDQLVDCAGFWVHVDMDVLDPAVMPAVDAPEPGGIAFPELELLLAGLVDTPDCLGVEITVFDPDYDPDGSYAEEITSALVAGLTPVRHVDPRPDLIAAREDLAAPQPPVEHVAKQRAGEAWPIEEPDPIEARRAAASAESVTLAAAAMSAAPETPDGTTEDSAVPATTLLAVEEANEPESRPLPADPSEDHPSDDPATTPDALDNALAAPDDTSPDALDTSDIDQAPHTIEPSSDEADEPTIVDSTNVEPTEAEPTNVAATDAEPFDAGPTDVEPFDAEPTDVEPTDVDAADVEPADSDADPGPEEDPEPQDHLAPVDAPEPDLSTPARPRADWLGSPQSRADWLGTSAARADWLSTPGRLGTRESATPGRLAPRPTEEAPEATTEPADAVDDETLRPLGKHPELDSEPLPATRPGMLRPRQPDEGFTLPPHRPAFDIGEEKPADIA